MFIPLHVHSSAGSPDGLGQASQIVKKAKLNGFKSIALTDHGSLAGIPDLVKSAKEHGLKPIIGCESYLEYDNHIYHTTLLARNLTGYQNLVTLQNESHKNIKVKGKNKFPIITLDMLSHYTEGLIQLTGCPSSAMYRNSNFTHDGYDKSSLKDSLSYVKTLVRMFGSENVKLELMDTMDQPHYQVVFDIHDEVKLPIIITTDSHYINKEDANIFPMTVEIKKGYRYDAKDLWLKSEPEVFEQYDKLRKTISIPKYKEKFENLQEYIDNSGKLADEVEEYSIFSKPKLPYISESERYDLKNYLELQLQNDIVTFADRFTKYSKLYTIDQQKVNEFLDNCKKQLEFEYKVLVDLNFLDYFVILKYIADFCKEKNIFVRARGSAGGSYILYLLGFMPINPILFELRFDRFLDYSRTDTPDADLDFPPDRRNELFEYLHNKFGMFPVSAYTFYSQKSVVHDIARWYKQHFEPIPTEIELAATEAADDEIDEDIVEHLALKTFLEYKPEIRQLYNAMIGTVRHRSQHAAAVCAIPEGMYAPIEAFGEKPSIAWSESGSRKDLTDIGLVKYDLLGVDALAKIQSTEGLIGKTFNYYDEDLSWLSKFTSDVLPINPMFNLISNGDTSGLFQFLSGAAIRLGKEVKPKSLNDVAAIISLNRPGTLSNGTAWEYSKWIENPRKLHPNIDPILKNTAGVILYQEQTMSVYAVITGEGAAGANDARKTLSPKNPAITQTTAWKEKYEKLHKNFITKGIQNGYEESFLLELWEILKTSTGYSFNASHALSYAYTALQQCWSKYYYPNEYYVGLLNYTKNSEKGREDIQEFLYEAAKNGVKVVKPNVNYSEVSEYIYSKEAGKIFLPLTSIAGIGETVAKAIYENKPYESLEKFMEKFPSTKMKAEQAKILKKLNKTLSKEEQIVEPTIKHSVHVGVRNKLYNAGAFIGIEGDNSVLDIPEYETKTDFEIFGFHILSVNTVKYLHEHNTEHEVCGYVTEMTEKTSKKGNKYMIVRLFPKNTVMSFKEQMYNQLKVNSLYTFVVDKEKYNTILGVKQVEFKKK